MLPSRRGTFLWSYIAALGDSSGRRRIAGKHHPYPFLPERPSGESPDRAAAAATRRFVPCVGSLRKSPRLPDSVLYPAIPGGQLLVQRSSIRNGNAPSDRDCRPSLPKEQAERLHGRLRL